MPHAASRALATPLEAVTIMKMAKKRKNVGTPAAR